MHLAEAAMRNKRLGQKLWGGMLSHFLKLFRGLLQQVKVPQSELYTPKAFRAGKATALAASGCTLGEILTAGEWKSAAFLSYIDETTLDSLMYLEKAIVESDDEA